MGFAKVEASWIFATKLLWGEVLMLLPLLPLRYGALRDANTKLSEVVSEAHYDDLNLTPPGEGFDL
jgi:hypothetical protein